MVTDFICPYAKAPVLPERPCAVETCAFNLSDIPISRAYRRCFLNYVKATSFNPYKKDEIEQVEFGTLSLELREQVAKILLDIKKDEEQEIKRTFYTSLFSIMTQDTTALLTKKQHDPIPYQQCCVCGASSEDLWFPKGGVLPSGYGYCSWACWQESPPPLLALTKMLEVDFSDMTKNLPYPHGQKSKVIFTLHLVRWIFGETTLT